MKWQDAIKPWNQKIEKTFFPGSPFPLRENEQPKQQKNNNQPTKKKNNNQPKNLTKNPTKNPPPPPKKPNKPTPQKNPKQTKITQTTPALPQKAKKPNQTSPKKPKTKNPKQTINKPQTSNHSFDFLPFQKNSGLGFFFPLESNFIFCQLQAESQIFWQMLMKADELCFVIYLEKILKHVSVFLKVLAKGYQSLLGSCHVHPVSGPAIWKISNIHHLTVLNSKRLKFSWVWENPKRF